jgi:hypothetical protein
VNQTVVDRLLPLVEAYALGRRHQKALLAKLRPAEKCEKAICHLQYGSDQTEWCEPCKRREPWFRAFAERRRTNRELLRRIEALGIKLSLPDPPQEPPEPKALLELMIGEP